MRRLLAVLALGAVVVACSEQATSPNPTPSFSATTNWERGSFSYTSPLIYVDCLGEDVQFSGEIPYQSHSVVSASGNTSIIFQYRPVTPHGPPYAGIGQTSGTIYWYKNGLPVNVSHHVGPGEVYTFTDHEVYVADNGDKLFVEAQLHLTFNANAELTSYREVPNSTQCER